jgi:subtilisin family serine protease
MKTLNTLMTALIALLLTSPASAVTIAVIDSGTDLKHNELKNKKWVNPRDIDDAVDNDDNGYIDDLNGWNFAEGNNKLIDKQFLGSFSKDVYKFFEIQTKFMKGTASADEISWMRAKVQEPAFRSELGVFGNFVHGTHVAGITAKDANGAKIMGLKIIPTKAPTIGGGGRGAGQDLGYFQPQAGSTPEKILMAGLRLLASQQAKALAPVGQYVADQKARLANCSFGTSTRAASGLVGPILKAVLRRDPTPEEVTQYSVFFVNEVVKAAKVLVASKGTFFLIAAGNDGMDNDVYPTSPANVKQDNTLTVAATLGYDRLASFSNYGAKMVDLAAPGVGILSTIPGNEYIEVSGTSQATPFVANVAGQVLDANPALSNLDLKKILMATADLKDFLKGKVASGGIVNLNRAVTAGRLSRSMQLADAIQAARVQVSDVNTRHLESFGIQREGYVLPLPGLFY